MAADHPSARGDSIPDTSRSSAFSTLGWACYLGCSWTWCIGMFLPVLLLRDYGWWGFAVFAVPNVLGAAAMGWVIRSPEQSRAMVERHKPAVALFGRVTVAFQLFFLTWLLSTLSDDYFLDEKILNKSAWPLILAVCLTAIVFSTAIKDLVYMKIAPAIWVISLTAAAIFYFLTSGPKTEDLFFMYQQEQAGLIWLAPVCVFGFSLCPYLDATFHLARQQVGPDGGRTSFGVGFLLIFFPMILFTCLYAGVMLWRLLGGDAGPGLWPNRMLLLHLILQLCFTAAVHRNQLAALGNSRPSFETVFFATAVFLGAVSPSLKYSGLSGGEVIYRCFIAFYGLLFPAYVWHLMIPDRRGHSGVVGVIGRQKLRAMLMSVGVAAPMFWMGFIELQELWLAPGLLVVLLARPIGQLVNRSSAPAAA